MPLELAVALAAVAVLYVAAFELLDRERPADADARATFRRVGGSLLVAGFGVLALDGFARDAIAVVQASAVSTRTEVAPAAMLLDLLLRGLGLQLG